MLSSLRFSTTNSTTSFLVYRFRVGAAIRSCRNLSYSRMLDMGGAPSAHTAKNKTRINASKNCKLQAVCFDFHVLTKFTTKQDNEQDDKDKTNDNSGGTLKLQTNAAPDASMVQQVADLLNVNLGGWRSSKKKNREDEAAYENEKLSK